MFLGTQVAVGSHPAFRTPDTRRASTIPRRLVRIPGRSVSIFGDRRADSDLGEEMQMTVAVPTFRTMCVHEGRLVIANTPFRAAAGTIVPKKGASTPLPAENTARSER